MSELKTLLSLIDSFSKLPGIGTKSAERMAYAVLEMKKEDILEEVERRVKDIKENLLGNINENNYQLLISVIDFYNSVCERERLINYVNTMPIYELLSNEGFIKELELIKKSEELYQTYNEFIGNYYRFDMNTEDLVSIQNISSQLSNEI